MDNERFLELVTKHLSNEITKQENEQLISLLKKEEYYKRYELIKTRWEKVENEPDNSQFNLNKGLEKLTSKIRKYEPGYGKTRKERKIKGYLYDNPLVKIAASIAFFITIAAGTLYLSGVFNSESNTITWNEKVTSIGQKSILTLFDGTKITLNADSKLKYHTNFGNEKREVYLEGEAYFEVAHNPDRSFIVHSDIISTTVLGTKFNVRAFPDEQEIEVSLVEGIVKVAGSGIKEKLLRPEQQLAYNTLTKKKQVKTFDLTKVTGWKENILVFDNVPLGKVLAELKRTFGVSFELEDKSYVDRRIKASFNNESFWTVIKVIKSATKLEYKTTTKNGEIQNVIFYRK